MIRAPFKPTQTGAHRGLLDGWQRRAAIWSVALAAAAYLIVALWSGWHEVATAATKVGLVGGLVALGLSLANYALRFVRWQFYLRAMDHKIAHGPSLQIYVAGFALTTTPGKAGEALRGVLLLRWGVPFAKSLAAFLSERLSDLVAVVALTLVGLTTYPATQPMIALGTAAIGAVLLVISNKTVLSRLRAVAQGPSRWRSLLRQLSEVLLQARRCHSPQLLAVATSLSLVAWAAEAWAFYLILHWMGLAVPIEFAVFVYAVSMLAGALSFMPGGLGGAEVAMVALLVMSGVSGAEAIAATVLIRLATLWFAVALGAVALMTTDTKRGDPPLED